MLAAAAARDTAFDGVFLTCVKTTGIYCLPSCKAKAPKPENVEHAASPDDARARGYRPCLRCRPDDRYAGIDRDRDALLAAVGRLRAAPGEFADVAAFAAAAGCGATKTLELCRSVLHATPGDLLATARVEHARRALAASGRRVLDVALDAGFESASAFHANFRARTGMAPRAWRRMLDGAAFEVALPDGHPVDACFAAHRRDAATAHDGDGDGAGNGNATIGASAPLLVAIVLAGAPCALQLVRRGRAVRVHVTAAGRRAPGREAMAAAHDAVTRMLRLDLDPAPGERALARDPRLRPLVRAARGLRPWAAPTPFACLVWAILGQQVHLSFAQQLRASLARRCGARVAGVFALPDEHAIAKLDPGDLVAAKASRAKAECLLAAARAVANGELDLDALALGDPAAADLALQRLRGIGPWTAQYVLLRGFRFGDCLPLGDSGLAAAAQRTFALPERPDRDALAALSAPFAPHRSLLTFHLWRSLATAAAPAAAVPAPRKPPRRAAVPVPATSTTERP